MSAIKKFRESLGLRQEDFAEIVHVSKVNYSKKENGKVKFSLDEAFLISNHFNKPIESIFRGKETTPNDTGGELLGKKNNLLRIFPQMI